MKKLLVLSLMIGTIAFVTPAAANAASANSVSEAEVFVQYGQYRRQNRRWNNRRVRTVTTTRIVGYGRNRYRETVRITYLPNGRTITRVIGRARIGRNY